MTSDNKNPNAANRPSETGEAGAAQPAAPPLSDTALVILAAAANRPDGSLLPVPASVKARRSTRSAVLFQLSQLGLAEEVPVKLEAESWRRGEEFGFLGMRITAAGLSAIGIETKGDSESVTEPFCEATSARRVAKLSQARRGRNRMRVLNRLTGPKTKQPQHPGSTTEVSNG